MNRQRAAGVGIVVGLTVGGSAHLALGVDPLLSAVLLVTWTVAAALLASFGASGRGSGRFDPWLAGLAVVYGASFLGVHYGLPLADDLTLALQALVLGTGFAGWGLGVGWARRRAAQPADGRGSSPGARSGDAREGRSR